MGIRDTIIFFLLPTIKKRSFELNVRHYALIGFNNNKYVIRNTKGNTQTSKVLSTKLI